MPSLGIQEGELAVMEDRAALAITEDLAVMEDLAALEGVVVTLAVIALVMVAALSTQEMMDILVAQVMVIQEREI